MPRKSLNYITGVGLFLAAFSGPGLAQSNGGQLNVRNVVAACSVSNDACQAATQSYLGSLRSAGLTPSEYNTALVDLVIALATDADIERGCDDRRDRLATAISLTKNFSVDSEQRDQIEDISEAVENCQEIQTAALVGVTPDGGSTVGSNASPN